MTVMIIHASIEGHTAKIADTVARTVEKTGETVERVDASDRTADIDFNGVTHVILAAPVHERRHPQDFEVILSANRDELARRRTLFLSVSLNAAFADKQDDAQDYVTETQMRTHFTPDAVALVAGAIKTGSYDYFETQVLRHTLLSGHGYDPSDGDREFTDWAALESTVKDFLAAA